MTDNTQKDAPPTDGANPLPTDFPEPPGETPIKGAEPKEPPKKATKRPAKKTTSKSGGRASKASSRKSPASSSASSSKKSAPDTPPKKRGRPPKPKIKDQVSQTAESVGTLLVMAGTIRSDQRLTYDGNVVLSRATEIGETIDEIAETNPAVKRALERMFAVSGWGKIGLTVAQVGVPIAACHGLVPPAAAMPFVHPDVGLPPVLEPPVPAANDQPNYVVNPRPTVNLEEPFVVPEPQNVKSHPDLPGWPADQPLPDPSPIPEE